MEQPRSRHEQSDDLPLLAEIEALLEDAKEARHRLVLAQAGADSVEHKDAYFFAQDDLRRAEEKLREAITHLTQERTISYDQALRLLDHCGFPYEEGSEAEFGSLLEALRIGEAVLLKSHHGYFVEDVRGKIASEPFVIPYGTERVTRPVILVEIATEYGQDLEFVQIRRKTTRTDEFTTPGVVIGEAAIEAYLANKTD